MESKISPGLSLYLDAARFLAAVSVLLYHTWDLFYPDSAIKWPGHEAVVVFFVLSGFVIAHATARPSMTWVQYLQHRCARIIPVAWAALLLGAIMGLVVPAEGSAVDTVWKPLLANAFFVAQSAHLSMMPAHNPPMWSLNYEVWYYVIFALFIYAPPKRRWLFAGLAALVAGPKIVVLLPVWLLGVLLYHRMPRMSPALAWPVLALSIVVVALATAYDVSSLLRSELYLVFPPAWHLHYSTQFLYDLLLGPVVAANFAAVSSLCQGVRVSERAGTVVRYLASFTFSTYVFHGPLIVLLREVLGVRTPLPFYVLMALFIFVLGQLTERRSTWFRAQFARLGRRAAVQPA